MADEAAFSITINIPRPRAINRIYKDIVEQTRIPKLGKSKRVEKKITLPLIAVPEPLPAATLKKEEILLPSLRYIKNQERDRFRKRLGANVFEDYRIVSNDLQERLHTDDPVDDSRGVTDYDPTYFMCIKSSTLSSYVAPFRSLRHIFNTQLRLRQEIGYRRDCMLNIENKHKKELEIYHISVKECMKQVKYLDEFISADYNKSMLFLTKWDKIKIAVEQKAFELQCLAAEKFTIQTKIMGLDYRYGLQQKYGRFLYYLSPPSWRLKNRNFAQSTEIEAKGFAFGISSEEDTFNVIFEKLKKECAYGLVKPVLYFQRPQDLLTIFEDIEQQHLHHFIHVSRLGPLTSLLKKGIKFYKDIIAQDSAGVITVIKEFEKMLSFREEQCSKLEAKFFKILNTFFYDCVGAPEVLKFQLHLDVCYAKIYNEKPMNLGTKGTAKALEDFYMEYMKRLESFTAEGISIAIKQYMEAERRKFRKAREAAKELRLFKQLEQALLRAFVTPPTNKISTIIFPSKAKHPAPKAEFVNTVVGRLSETEIEYLSLFTDWTEKENPTQYLRSLSLQDDENVRKTFSNKK